MEKMMRKLKLILTMVCGLLLCGSVALSFAAPFTDNGSTVTDQGTGLVWQKQDDGNTRTWDEALSYCEGLSLAGQNDWRLPNVKELESLTDDTRLSPAIDTNFFPDAYASYYWSSTTYAYNPGKAWYVDFNDGGVDYRGKAHDYYVRCVRGGQSGSLGPLTISPSSYDFGNLNPGIDSYPVTFIVTNTSSANKAITFTGLSGTNPYDFTIGANTCAGATLLPSWTCDIQASFGPWSYGAKAATLTVKTGTSPATATLTGTGGATGNSTISGTVYNQNYQPLFGATVKIGSSTMTTGADGSYSFTNMPPGNASAIVTKTGYAPAKETVSIPPYASTVKDFRLATASASGITVTNIASKYSGFIYFVTGTDFNVTFTADVFWGNHPPGYVRFITSKGVYDVTTTGTSAVKAFNIGTEFQPCTTLKVVAVSSDGTQSSEESADFAVMSPLFGSGAFRAIDLGDGFYYQSKTGLNLVLLDAGIAKGIIPSNIPVLGGKNFNLKFIPSVEVKSESSGTENITLAWNNILGKMDAGLVSVELSPKLDVESKFVHPGCYRTWGGFVGLKADVTVMTPPIYPFAEFGVPIYFKAGVGLTADVALGVENLSPVKLRANAPFSLDPYIEGDVGLGADVFFAAEGWVKGGAKLELQYPAEPHLKDSTIYIKGGYRIEAVGFEHEAQLFIWDWSLNDANRPYRTIISLTSPDKPKLIARDYLNKQDYGRFIEEPVFRVVLPKAGEGRYRIETAQLAVNVYPSTQPNLSSGGTKLSLAYLTDNTTRTAINRTMTVFSSYNGTRWSAPQPIADDGTADFHPQTLTFSGGSVIAAWENEKSALPDTATFDDSVKNLEIAVSVYDPATKTWVVQHNLTDNEYIDMAPRLSGKAKNNTLLVWASNPANDLNGSAINPNKLWYSKYNGTIWSAPKLIADIPYGLLKYSLLYDGTKARVVLSLDTDGDRATVNDHEFFMLQFDSGAWGPLTQITTDAVPDDNPQLALDPAGKFLLVWLKGNEVTSALDFDLANRTVIRTDEYTSNLADFKLASSSDGNISLVWAEASEYSSDLYAIFYDPTLKVWGSPEQLTADAETERNITAAFYGNDTLVAAYNRNVMGVQAITRSAATGKMLTFDVPTVISSDLYMLKHTMANDLSLDAGSLTAGPANPEPGQAVTFTVTARNLGDSPAENAVVAFYNGDPAAGGIKIREKTILKALKPGDAANVTFSWTVPQATAAPITIYAIIDPDSVIDTENRSNNSLSISMVKPDLAIANIRTEKLSDTLIAITARITNNGVLPSTATTATFRKATASGPKLSSQNIPVLGRFESYDINYIWDVAAIPAGSYTTVITVDEGNSVDEFDESNNTETVTIEGFSPSNLAAKATSSTQIVLTWTDRAMTEKGYKIERKDGACSSTTLWEEIAAKAKNITTHKDTALTSNTVYSYRIRAYNTTATSAYSNCASATTGKDGTPDSPTGLKAAATGANTVSLSWADSAGETSFKVYKKTGAGAWSLLVTAPADKTTAKDTAATGNDTTTEYNYYVKACNADGCSPSTSIAVVPYKPLDLAASKKADTVNLVWSDKSSDEAGFQIYRKAGDCSSAAAWKLVSTTGPDATGQSYAGLAAGTYAYKVRSFNKSAQPYANGYSLYTNCVEVVMP